MQQIVLRPDQVKLKSDIYNSWNEGNRNVCAVAVTGFGKTILASDVTLDHHNAGQKVAIIAHRNELVSQMSLTVARRGIPHRIIGSDSTVAAVVRKHREKLGKSFINPSASTGVVGVDTMMARSEDLKDWAKQISLWEIDECFPAGTLILTPFGNKPIESIKIGDSVIAFNENNNRFEVKKVNRLFKNPISDRMMRLTISGHHVIDCTEGHPFWTKRGWVNASNLTIDDEVLNANLSRCTVHNLRESFFNERTSQKRQIQKNRESLLFKNLYGRIFKKNIFRNNEQNKFKVCLRENEVEKSNVQSGDTKKSFYNSASNQTSPTSAGWEWERTSRSRKKTNRIYKMLRVFTTTCYKNWNEKRFWLSDMLQTRYGTSFFKNCFRSGWKFSHCFFKTRSRFEKRCVSNFIRLESIEIQERTNFKQSLGSYVFNIEVDGLHTYIANNIVVHNCHHTVGNWEVDAHGSMIYKTLDTGQITDEPKWRTDPNKWGKCASMFTNARGLGFTATPSRADGQGLGWEYDGVFHSMVQGPDMRWLIDNGMLSEYELVCPESDFKIDEDKRGKDGDFTHMEMRKASKNSHLVGDVVSNYARYAYGRRAIVFATDVETANEMAIRFQQFGIRAASVNGKSATAYREQCINEFAAGKIQVLINVDLFDEGFDVPACDVIIMARPTASLGKYLQMVGRGLRYMPGKTALIIDHVSNIIRHKLPDKKRIWTLARRDKRAKMRKDPDELELRTCKGCRKPYEAFRIACPYCGTEKPLPVGGGRSIEQVEGDLVLLDKATLDRMRAATTLENAADVGNRVGAAAGAIAGKGAANRQIEKITAHMQLQETIAQWAGYERAKGYNDREIHKRFYLTAGVDILSALDGSHGRKEYDIINETVKGWMEK
jgi:superfamily II DNA or RNA helicase